MASRSAHDVAAARDDAGRGRGSPRSRWEAAARRLPEDVRQVTSGLAGSRAFVALLIVLVTADGALIMLHVLQDLRDMGLVADSRWTRDPQFLLTRDRGYGEIWGYAKGVAIAVAFFALSWKWKAPVFAALGFTFLVIVLDDGLMLHEVYGYRLAGALALEPAFGLQEQDFGELLVWSGLGSVVVAALAYGFWRSRRQARRVAAAFLVLVAALAFFAVAVDMLHIVLTDAFRGAHRLWPLIEESGELVVLSLTCAAAMALVGRSAPPASGV